MVAVNAARESFERALAAAQTARDSLEQGLADTRATVETSRRALDEAGALLARREAELAKARHAHAALQGEQRALQAALAAQERVIQYQHGLRWWLRLPWLRMKRGWRQWRGQ